MFNPMQMMLAKAGMTNPMENEQMMNMIMARMLMGGGAAMADAGARGRRTAGGLAAGMMGGMNAQQDAFDNVLRNQMYANQQSRQDKRDELAEKRWEANLNFSVAKEANAIARHDAQMKQQQEQFKRRQALAEKATQTKEAGLDRLFSRFSEGGPMAPQQSDIMALAEMGNTNAAARLMYPQAFGQFPMGDVMGGTGPGPAAPAATKPATPSPYTAETPEEAASLLANRDLANKAREAAAARELKTNQFYMQSNQLADPRAVQQMSTQEAKVMVRRIEADWNILSGPARVKATRALQLLKDRLRNTGEIQR